MGTSLHFLPGTCRVLALLQAVRLITPTRFLHLGRASFQQVPKEKQRGAGEATPNQGLTRQARLMAWPPYTGGYDKSHSHSGRHHHKSHREVDKTLTPCRDFNSGWRFKAGSDIP